MMLMRASLRGRGSLQYTESERRAALAREAARHASGGAAVRRPWRARAKLAVSSGLDRATHILRALVRD